MAARQVFSSLKPLRLLGARQMSGEWGSGAGKGGGSGGTVRDAGGAFGKREAAQEEQYFRRLEQEQLKRLKDHLDEEVTHHEKEIKRHMEAIERHKKRMENLHKEHKGDSK